MEEQKVNFETAKLAKEKGFNIDTLDSFYLNRETVMEISVEDYPFAPFNWNSNTEFDFARPTQSLLAKWLREVHRLHVEVHMYIEDGLYMYESLIKSDSEYEMIILRQEKYLPNWERTLEIGLQEALKLIPNK
jgi:hypothetical protein